MSGTVKLTEVMAEKDKELARLRAKLDGITHFDCCREAGRSEQYKRERDEARALAEGWREQAGGGSELPWETTLKEKPDPGRHMEPATWNPEFTTPEEGKT